MVFISPAMPKGTPSRIRATCLALAAIAVLVAGVLPACASALCCGTMTPAQTVHAQMPCCAGHTSSLSPRGDERQPATLAAGSSTSPLKWAPAIDVAFARSSCSSSLRADAVATVSQARFLEPSPPLFLQHAQFLI